MRPFAQRLIGSAASTVDRAFVAALQFQGRGARARAEGLSHEQRLASLAHIGATYGKPGLLDHPDAYFPRPSRDDPAVQPRVQRVRALPWGGECLELSWATTFSPFDPVTGARYLAHVPNRTAHARLYTAGGSTKRPTVIAIHGYMGGHWAVEERTWPIRWLNQHGLDVAVAVLPFHGLRARPGDGAPPFPGGDPRVTNEGFRQIVADVRALATLLRERGAPAVGVMGMSLGGYSTALLATVEGDLAFAVPLIPLASVADYARDQGNLGAGDRGAKEHAALESANRVVSPFARPALLSKDRLLIIAAEDDQVTPIAHAERLAAHFDVRLFRVNGGHLLQTWRKSAFRALHAMLMREGIV